MKQVLIVTDVNNWAFAHWANGIHDYSGNDFDVTVMSGEEFGNLRKTDTQFVNWCDRIDGILLCSWAEADTNKLNHKTSVLVASPGLKYNYPPENPFFLPSWIATRNRNRSTAEKIRKFYKALCTTDELVDAANTFNCGKSVRVVVGVDHNIYEPRWRMPVGKLRIGWCGQRGGITKGQRRLLEPIMAELGDRVEFRVNDRDHQDALTQEEMVNWYDGIDVFLTTGCAEGGPSQVPEAMSCGKAVIGTQSGYANEIVTTDCGVIVGPYHDKETAAACVRNLCGVIRYLDENRPNLVAMNVAARKRVMSGYTWEKLAPQWLGAICG